VIKNEARFGEVFGAKANIQTDDDDFDTVQEHNQTKIRPVI
jgi:hypothetical protein